MKTQNFVVKVYIVITSKVFADFRFEIPISIDSQNEILALLSPKSAKTFRKSLQKLSPESLLGIAEFPVLFLLPRFGRKALLLLMTTITFHTEFYTSKLEQCGPFSKCGQFLKCGR